MKKLIVIAAALILSTSVVFAQNAAPQNAVINKKSSAHPANGPCRYCPLDKGMMMHGMMMRMVNASMVATSDGGVIVLAGDDLIKYDKDLNVVKKVEIKGNMHAMHKMMKNCPIMKSGMMGGANGQAEKNETSK